MKASYKWLRELVPQLTASPKELAARLTGAGLEVEGLTEYGEGAEACLLVSVVAIRPHPTKSGLRLVTVDRGGVQQEVVCGAPNVPDPGGMVVLAPLGAHLPAAGLTIAKRAIGGVESEGMLCSESELGLSDDEGGILVFPSAYAKPGTPFVAMVPNARDTVLEIGLTPNRPDGLGHIGLAREICALYNFPFALPKADRSPAGEPGTSRIREANVATKDLVAIQVDDAERCPHYGAAGAVDVVVQPSPPSVRYRLQALGVRSISNVVDITNILMLEWGHPMHAFDLDRVRPTSAPRIHVRRAKAGESIVTLDGVTRMLVEDDLLICDGEGPTALAGVMGGATSEIHVGTTRVLFECAWFDPRGVRRSARRHGMHTESSHRFERGVDPGDVAHVLARAVALTCELAGASATKGQVHVQGARVSDEAAPPSRKTLVLREARIEGLLGIRIPFADALSILERLGCTIAKREEGRAEVLVPTHRPDLGREVDLVEEVLRVHGIDHVPAELPPVRASRDIGGREELASRARTAAVALGLSEAITFSFTSRATLEALGAPEPTVILKNPLAEHQAVMRTSLLPGLLDAVRNARRHGERDVKEFTIGPVFLARNGKRPARPADETLPDERLRLAVVLAGERPAWLTRPVPFDVWDMKGYAIELASRLSGQPAESAAFDRAAIPRHLHPRGAAKLVVAGQEVGAFGILHPDAASALELDGEVLVLEMELDPFVAGPKLPAFSAIPKFPASPRDVALVVKDGIPAGDVVSAVRAAAGPLAEDVRLFDRFVGGQVPAGHSSLAIRVVYRAPDRTLTDADVDAAHANVVKAVSERFGATLRA